MSPARSCGRGGTLCFSQQKKNSFSPVSFQIPPLVQQVPHLARRRRDPQAGQGSHPEALQAADDRGGRRRRRQVSSDGDGGGDGGGGSLLRPSSSSSSSCRSALRGLGARRSLLPGPRGRAAPLRRLPRGRRRRRRRRSREQEQRRKEEPPPSLSLLRLLRRLLLRDGPPPPRPRLRGRDREGRRGRVRRLPSGGARRRGGPERPEGVRCSAFRGAKGLEKEEGKKKGRRLFLLVPSLRLSRCRFLPSLSLARSFPSRFPLPLPPKFNRVSFTATSSPKTSWSSPGRRPASGEERERMRRKKFRRLRRRRRRRQRALFRSRSRSPTSAPPVRSAGPSRWERSIFFLRRRCQRWDRRPAEAAAEAAAAEAAAAEAAAAAALRCFRFRPLGRVPPRPRRQPPPPLISGRSERQPSTS